MAEYLQNRGNNTVGDLTFSISHSTAKQIQVSLLLIAYLGFSLTAVNGYYLSAVCIL